MTVTVTGVEDYCVPPTVRVDLVVARQASVGVHRAGEVRAAVEVLPELDPSPEGELPRDLRGDALGKCACNNRRVATLQRFDQYREEAAMLLLLALNPQERAVHRSVAGSDHKCHLAACVGA